MPYKNPEHKREWEREHRAGSRQPASPKSTFDLRTALRNARKAATDPVSAQKPQPAWKALLGLAVGIGVVLLAVFAGVSPPDSGIHGSAT